MEQWEYMSTSVHDGDLGSGKTLTLIIGGKKVPADTLGMQGWELVNLVLSAAPPYYIAIFKRRK
jgi:hypothetical protein